MGSGDSSLKLSKNVEILNTQDGIDNLCGGYLGLREGTNHYIGKTSEICKKPELKVEVTIKA